MQKIIVKKYFLSTLRNKWTKKCLPIKFFETHNKKAKFYYRILPFATMFFLNFLGKIKYWPSNAHICTFKLGLKDIKVITNSRLKRRVYTSGFCMHFPHCVAIFYYLPWLSKTKVSYKKLQRMRKPDVQTQLCKHNYVELWYETVTQYST